MIIIVSGPVNSGKSSWMKRDALLYGNSDGFICEKVFEQDVHVGYNLFCPFTQDSVPLIRKPCYSPPDWIESERIAELYSFSSQGFAFAETITKTALQRRQAVRFYLDEIGFLELEDRGFASQLHDLLQARVDLVIAVRDFLLDKVIAKFSINDSAVIVPGE